jgi:hypothetical protein
MALMPVVLESGESAADPLGAAPARLDEQWV